MSNRNHLATLVERLAEARVTCVGDVLLDRFVEGEVTRISPEAPIPVLGVSRETEMPGGAGNVARNLSALGAACRFVSVVGADETGRRLGELLDGEAGVEPRLVIETERRTGTKTRYLAAGQQLLRADRETVAPISDDAAIQLVAAAGTGGVMVLSDYGKGVLRDDVIARLIAAADVTIVDPKGSDFSRYRGADLITPNRAELAEATGMAVDSEGDVVAAAKHLIDTCGIAAVLATRGRDGMILVADGKVLPLPAEAREVFDVSGAGDTVVAALAAALASGADLADAARLSNLAGGIVVGKVGTAVVRAADLLAGLHSRDLSGGDKIGDGDQALERIARWRRQGLTIGFTNGCFDILHAGHVSLLAQARAACDRLVVGLNSDTSVARLKGPQRPVQPEASRAAVLASLASVDCVVLFSEDTPLKVIKAVRPDLLVKGADYAIDQVVGADLVQGYGGTVMLVELSPGHSTTAILKRIGTPPQ